MTTVVVEKRVIDFAFGFVVDFVVNFGFFVDFTVRLVDDLEVDEDKKELVSSVDLPKEKVTSKIVC